MQKLLIATTNPGKLSEYKAQLADLPLELFSLAEFGMSAIEETGETFEENALLKARTYFKQSARQNDGKGVPCIADDGGLEIDALGGEPGVHSHRWLGRESSDEELIAEVLKRMGSVPEAERTARLRTVIIFIAPDGSEHCAEGITEGLIAQTVGKYEAGLPYRALLFINQFQKPYGELSEDEHAQVNQRIAAIQKLKPRIRLAFS